eukprot:6208154-Pleurochrysis_carterae.AAC.5
MPSVPHLKKVRAANKSVHLNGHGQSSDCDTRVVAVQVYVQWGVKAHTRRILAGHGLRSTPA